MNIAQSWTRQQLSKLLQLHAVRRGASTSIERSINRVTLVGRVGADAQVKGNAEHPVTTFSLATHTTYRTAAGETRQKTEWHKVSVFKPGLRTLAENYVRKGGRLLVEGRVTYGEIIDAQGHTIQATTIIADDIMFMSPPSNNNENTE
ncbi:Single-stranded DNA-binding protein, mitochondrial, partial [Fragariocoptes setiger]